VQLCDRAVLLENGRQLLDGNPQEVTKQYHRLIFSKSIDREKILHSMSRILPDSSSKEPNVIVKEDVDTGSFLINLIPVSELKYPRNGGEIIQFEIQDLNGRKVNLVPSGFSGIIRVQARFDESFQDVIFGFYYKTVSGLELAGLTYPAIQEKLIKVNAGDTVEVHWPVKFPFVPGTYFFTFGVRSISSDGFIHRIVDGMVLRISERQNSRVQGLVDMSNGNSGMKISPKGFEYD